jgi:hypothetical protein
VSRTGYQCYQRNYSLHRYIYAPQVSRSVQRMTSWFSSLFYSLLSRQLQEAIAINSIFRNCVYGLDYPRFKSPQTQEIFSSPKYPDRIWDTRSLLFDGYWRLFIRR